MLANLVGSRELAVLGQRIAHTALIVVLAADETLERARVLLRDELRLLAGGLAHRALADDHIGLFVCLAVRVDADDARLRAEGRHLHLGHPARGAQLLHRLDLALRERVGHIAVGPPSASDEHPARLLRGANLQVLAAFGALAHIRVSGDGIGKGVLDFLGMGHEVGQLLGEQVAGVHDHICLGLLAFGDVVHLRFEFRRHLRVGDMRRELVERVAHRHAKLRGLDGVVLDVLHRVEALDDAVARGLRAEPELFHLLDELALAVAGGRLGLLLRAGGAVEGDLLALGERRQLLVFLHAVGVDGAISLVHEDVALRGEVLA